MQKFCGALTAIITPFRDGRVDEQSYIDLINFQIEQGIHGIVPCGTTGESATLSYEEHKRVIELTVQTVAGRVPVIAGTGANNTLEAIELSESAQASGADAVLSVVPYYNKPSQQGMYEHFKAIAGAVDIPVFLYNVPGRTVVNMLPETVAKLASIDNIIGIKEACGSLEQLSDLLRLCPEDFLVLSGDDFTAMPSVLIGGHGVISVVSNLAPKATAELMSSALEGDLVRAKQLHFQLYPLMKLMFKNPSPAPAKKALQLMGTIVSDETRLPIVAAEADTVTELREVLASLQML